MFKRFLRLVSVLVAAIIFAAIPALAQSEKTKAIVTVDATERTSQALYEDANGYLGRRYQEFNKQNLPYDAKLEARIKQEQKDLAAKNAAILEARGPLAGDDLYFLGMLYHLNANSDKAFEVMHKFVETGGKGDKAQVARAVIVVHAIKKNLLPEAETAVAGYLKNQPQNLEELFGMHTLVAEAFFTARDYERMATYARGMITVSKLAIAAKKVNNIRRDDMLFKSYTTLADAQLKANKKSDAVATYEELRTYAFSLPSGNLYKLAKQELEEINAGAKAEAFVESHEASAPPEIIGSQWIDLGPTKLADLKGKVVLLDFWAPWCGPCLFTFPRLQRWHAAYKDKGLVILGVTRFYGEAEGRRLSRAEEVIYLNNFKKKNRLPYGIIVTDTAVNDLNYGAFTIPMSFLIDRRGNLRYISPGANEAEALVLGKMIKKLIDEPAGDSTSPIIVGAAGAQTTPKPQ